MFISFNFIIIKKMQISVFITNIISANSKFKKNISLKMFYFLLDGHTQEEL